MADLTLVFLLPINTKDQRSLVTHEETILLSDTPNTTKLLDLSLQPVGLVKTFPSQMAWRIQWFLYLNQRRKFLSNVHAWKDTDQFRRHRKKRAKVDCAHQIPIPFLQIIQLVASLGSSDLVSLRQPPDRVETQARDQESCQQLANFSKIRDEVLPTPMRLAFPTATRLIELHCNNVDYGKITEKLTDKRHIRHNKVEVVSPMRYVNFSLVEAASPGFQHSPVERDDETESSCILESHNLNGCVDESQTYSMGAILPFDQSPVLSMVDSLQMSPAQQHAMINRNPLDDERSITNIFVKSTKESWFR
jgi:hypothetical protein